MARLIDSPDRAVTDPTPQPADVLFQEVRRKRRRRRLRNLGVVLLGGLLVAGGIVVFGGGPANKRPAGLGTPGPASPGGSNVQEKVPPVPLASPVPFFFQEFQLLAPGVGWVLEQAPWQIAITYNDGRSWQYISPSLAGKVVRTPHPADYGSFAMTSEKHFMFEASAGTFAGEFGLPQCGPGNADPSGDQDRSYSALEVTNDGGSTWKSETLPGCASPDELSFVGAQRGFALSISLLARTQPVVGTLFRTDNGGITWVKVANAPIDGSIDFTNANVGWGIAEPNGSIAHGDPKGVSLWHTSDGGTTWRKVALPNLGLLKGQSVAPVSTTVQFFGSNDGVLPLQIVNAAGKIIAVRIVSTTDGGRSWHLNKVPATFTRNMPYFDRPGGGFGDGSYPVVLSIESATRWFIGVGTTIYVTQNSGRTWTHVSVPKGSSSVSGIDFVSPKFGWVTAFTPGGPGVNPVTRFRQTTDGGRTWKSFDSPQVG